MARLAARGAKTCVRHPRRAHRRTCAGEAHLGRTELVLQRPGAGKLGHAGVSAPAIEETDAEPIATTLRARRLGLTAAGNDPIAVMRHDCPVCRSEGLASRAQIRLRAGGHEVVVSLLHSSADIPAPGEIGLSE